MPVSNVTRPGTQTLDHRTGNRSLSSDVLRHFYVVREKRQEPLRHDVVAAGLRLGLGGLVLTGAGWLLAFDDFGQSLQLRGAVYVGLGVGGLRIVRQRFSTAGDDREQDDMQTDVPRPEMCRQGGSRRSIAFR